MKNQLVYSSLTDEVYYLDGKGQRKKIPNGNFIQMVLLWLNEGNTPNVGEKFERTLSVKGAVHWKITCERVSDGRNSNL